MRHADMPQVTHAWRGVGHGPVAAIMIQHAAPPHCRLQIGERHLPAFRVGEQRHVLTGLAEVHALHHRARIPHVMIADDDDGFAIHARELFIDKIDGIFLDFIVVEQVPGNQK